MVLNGPCRDGSAVKAREPLHERGRAAGQGALSGVGGVVWERPGSEREISNSNHVF